MNTASEILSLNELWQKIDKSILVERLENILSQNGVSTFSKQWKTIMDITGSSKHAVYAWLNKGRNDVKIPFLKLCMIMANYDHDIRVFLMEDRNV